jgi:two-component SAPR family response regulator
MTHIAPSSTPPRHGVQGANITPTGQAAEAAAPPVPSVPLVPLVIRSFGQPEVLVAGQPAQWHAASAQELFFYLLSFPGGRTRAEILEELWGLDESAASANRFRVTAHRLRAALGFPGAMVEAYGRYHLAPEVFQASDVQLLYAAMHDAETADSPQARLQAYTRALEVYAGEYLPQVQADWARQAREEHQAAFVRASVEVSLLHCELNQCREAVTSLAGALKADPFIGENYHQRLMTCLSVVEGHYAAIEHYRRFIRFLHDDLNDTPMPETRALAERLKCGEHICNKPQDALAASAHVCPFASGGHCSAALGGLLQLN